MYYDYEWEIQRRDSGPSGPGVALVILVLVVLMVFTIGHCSNVSAQTADRFWPVEPAALSEYPQATVVWYRDEVTLLFNLRQFNPPDTLRALYEQVRACVQPVNPRPFTDITWFRASRLIDIHLEDQTTYQLYGVFFDPPPEIVVESAGYTLNPMAIKHELAHFFGAREKEADRCAGYN